MRESFIEQYLHTQVELAGGTTRKYKGRIHAPDRLVIWSKNRYRSNFIHFVETKAPGKKPRPGQLREHQRLRDLDCEVHVIDTREKVDAYVEANK